MSLVTGAAVNVADSDRKWKFVQKFAEQRHYPRLDIELPVSFRNAEGRHCCARLSNISIDGLQIRCNPSCGQALHPGGGKISQNNAPLVQTALKLPFSDQQRQVSLGARLVSITTASDEPRCVIGMQFLDPRPIPRSLLERFFSEHLGEYFEFDGAE